MQFLQFGEWVLRLIYGIKLVKTNKDKERLLPLFEEVYNTIKEKENYKNNHIKLYIDKSMTVNAYAIGTGTISITRGVIDTLTDNQIKGLLAHEFGHIIHGDTLIPLILIVGNLFLLLAFLTIKMLELMAIFVEEIMGDNSKLFSSVIKGILNIGLFLIVQIIQILILINRRKNEYKADDFSFEAGYRDDLLETLYILKKIDLGGKMSLLERIKSSHPNIDDRISRLEGKDI